MKEIRGDGHFDFIKCSAAQHLGLHRQSYPLFNAEPKSLSFELFAENSVLFHEMVDDYLSMAVKPTCQGDDQQME